ncbi:MAG: DUF1549 domain-containing protein [Verrucomicrobiaceae bacterium]|nr:DUF1549 domain-containing protein [Verrucomicrobiaceae bacterium]
MAANLQLLFRRMVRQPSILLLFSVGLLGITDSSANEPPWSFQRLQRPALPKATDPTWPKQELDLFYLAKNKPLPDASRATLIRRVAFDLTGLPPTWTEVEAFVNDRASDDDALAKVVDAYLKSPRFGERWARHWLDVVRYADSVGRTWNAPFTYAWKYRDWVIDSFNSDKPYNRFVAEQIAGDLIPAKTVEERRDQIIGTGMLALGAMDLSEGSDERFIMDQVDDQIDVTSRAFMGLTIACARCHDHKTDPVSMKDYYALAGVFYSSRTLPGQAAKWNLTGAGYVDPEMLVDLPAKLDEELTSPSKLPSGIHSMGDVQDYSRGNGRTAPPYDVDPFFAMGVLEDKARNCEICNAGDPYDRGAAPRRAGMEIPSLPKLSDVKAGESGRKQYADWMTQPTHPLTSRVMANRIWAHLFGQGIVRTVDDFGVTGASPSDPALLDHLAVQFVTGGWSVKKLIRSIVLSRTYRQQLAQARRIDFESIRDAMLFIADRLDTSRPEGIQVSGIGGKGNTGRVRALIGMESPWRTIYLPVLRDLLPDDYSTWDFPPPTQIKGQRDVTTVPPQSLWFMNSDFSSSVSTDAANKLKSIEAAYQAILGRDPSAEERSETSDFDTETLVQALFATAEFRYLF